MERPSARWVADPGCGPRAMNPSQPPLRLRLVLEAARTLRRRIWPLARFEVLHAVVAATLLVPLFSWQVERLVASTGGRAVTNFEIVAFLLSPVGLVTALASGVGLLCLDFLHRAGILCLVMVRTCERPLGAVATARRVWVRLPRLLALAALQIAGFGLALLPFALIAAWIAQRAVAGFDVNYLVTERPPEFWRAAVELGLVSLAAAVAVGLLYLRWVFALPVLLFEGGSPRSALTRSRELVRGRRWRVLTVFVLWWVLLQLVALALLPVVSLGSDLLLSVGAANLSALVVVSALLLALELAGAAIVTFVAATTRGILAASLYLEGRGDRELELAPAGSVSESLVTRRGVVLGAVLLAGGAFVTGRAFLSDLVLEDATDVTAHRGSSRRAPENTLAAIRAAIEDGADWAEIDVQRTADGVVVLLHDTDLRRVAGRPDRLTALTAAQLRGIDVGAWFDERFAGEPIPTLTEVIEECRGRLRLNIELKPTGDPTALVRAVVDVVRTADFGSECVFTSLNLRALHLAREMAPEVPVGLAVGAALGDPAKLDVDFFTVGTGAFDQDLFARLRARGRGVHVWTVNEPADMHHFLSLGVDNLITDEPALAARLIRERAELDPSERLLLAIQYGLP